MTVPIDWQKSSYSEGGDGNTCVEIAPLATRVAIRDSKDPSQGTVTVPFEAFTALVRSFRAAAP
ncbi:DUF397 domain-containing protein [Streptomyces mutabilis]|uniref:DUF397 domain-containing protein n=1 Tax=Streptomyces TaxID=1883 RepID=UPI000BD3B503|nr:MULTISPECIES: DUF397 domain-containing protein [unclassified Streptomyces]MDN3246202.1 DUF397 domain-containing protein [Streptomyces sp. ZSW22]MDN3252530.1 DUF397 domain-containing protein [Streptomyces sp. MA25(2023)]PAK26872.1 DUF397 domain-containing protein [Streptomyces sp. alain-838]